MAKSKKRKAQKVNNQVEAAEVVDANVENVQPAEEKPAKAKVEAKKEPKAKKQKKAKEPKQNKVKETVAELKKVTWPTFPKVVKNTLLVLGIVVLFTVVLFGIDFGLSWLYRLLTSTL